MPLSNYSVLLMYLEIAIAAAKAGGEVLMDKFGTTLRVEHKGEVDLVTEADQAAEAAIVSLIRKRFPAHDILAEEEDYHRQQQEFCWIIDPLDGTTNYAHGFPWFAVSVALERQGEVIVGVVYNPFNAELYTAAIGKGAWLNGKQLFVSSTASIDQSLLATGFPYDRKQSKANNYDNFINFQQAVQACRRPGAASLDLACTAAGRFDGYWEMKLKPWDVAAGSFIAERAGGKCSDFSGGDNFIYGREIVCGNPAVFNELLNLSKKYFQ